MAYVKASAIAVLILVAGSVLLVRAEIEFAGYMGAGSEMKFLVGDPAAGKKPDWVVRGGNFDGYTLVEFDARRETLRVSKAGQDKLLPLRNAGTRMARPVAPGPTPNSSTLTAATNNGQVIVAGQMMATPAALNNLAPIANGNRAQLTAQLTETKVLLTNLGTRYADKHPTMVILGQRAAEIEKQIALAPP